MEKTIFKGKVISLYERKIRNRKGKIYNLEVIKHPGAVLIVPFLSRSKIILIKQLRPVIKKYLWELPAGTLRTPSETVKKKKETFFSCAKRELEEETGYQAKRITYLGEIYPAPGYSNEKIKIFKAEKLIKTKTSFDEDENIEVVILEINKIQKMCERKKITDAKTLSALALAKII